MKKVLSVLLALMMIASLTACGAKSQNTATPAPAEKKESTAKADNNAAASAADTTTKNDPSDIYSWILEENPESISGTVRFWVPFKSEQGMGAMIEDFNSVYPNITVELNTYNNNAEGNVAVNAAMMAGEIDVLHSFELYHAYERWENNLYMDITDRCAEEGIDLAANWGNDLCKYEDRIYTLPAGGQSYFLCVNRTEWDKAGLGDIPTSITWDEYMEASKKMTHDGVVGGSSYSAINTVTDCLYQVYGKNALYNDDGTSRVNDPILIKALNREVEGEKAGYFYPLTSYRYDDKTVQGEFLGGRTASTISCNLTRFLRDTKTYPIDFKVAFIPWPVEEAGQTNYMDGVSTFSHVGMASNCNMKDIDAIWAFTKWYSTYGCKYLAIAGHMPTWKGTDADSMVDLVFGSEADAAKLIDVESYKRVVCNFDGNPHVDTILTAYSECVALMQEYVMYAHTGEMSVEDALNKCAKLSNDAIKEAQ